GTFYWTPARGVWVQKAGRGRRRESRAGGHGAREYERAVRAWARAAACPRGPGRPSRMRGWQCVAAASMMTSPRPAFSMMSFPTPDSSSSILDFLAGGLLQFGWGEMLLYLLVATQLTIFAVTLYLHRS